MDGDVGAWFVSFGLALRGPVAVERVPGIPGYHQPLPKAPVQVIASAADDVLLLHHVLLPLHLLQQLFSTELLFHPEQNVTRKKLLEYTVSSALAPV